MDLFYVIPLDGDSVTKQYNLWKEFSTEEATTANTYVFTDNVTLGFGLQNFTVENWKLVDPHNDGVHGFQILNSLSL